MSEWLELDENIIITFRNEAADILADLEASLLALEEDPADKEMINRVFRNLHTIKGSSAMLGLDRISSCAHEFEEIFAKVRSGKIEVRKKLIDQTLSSLDHISTMISALDYGKEPVQAEVGGLASFRPVARGNRPEEGGIAPARKTGAERGTSATYRIRYRPLRDIFSRGTDPLALLRSVAELGDCRVVAQLDNLPCLHALDPEMCYICWDIILTTSLDENAIRAVFTFIDDESELRIEVIDKEGLIGDEDSYKRLGEILVERGDLSTEDVRRVIQDQKRFGQMLVEAGMVDEGKVYSALVEQEHVRAVRQKQMVSEMASGVRVSLEKLDNLVDLVGELVTVQARLTGAAGSRKDPELVHIAETVERLTAHMRDATMRIRMVPVGSMVGRLRRLVRDLSAELGKDVELHTYGAETELDKTLIDRLHDPLVHLIRNAIDHGIESPGDRKNVGKPPGGSIHLSAVHSGANVIFQISDDGAGIDTGLIRTKAVEKGLAARDADLSEKDILGFLFAPGFSTARNVTHVSGRGVGMDIVKKGIEALRGTIDIRSRKGSGTSIMLTLPLTLAIIDGLLVRVADASFIIPLRLVEECVELTGYAMQRAQGRCFIPVRGRPVPFIRLRERFSTGGAPPGIEQVVIVATDEGRAGLAVDEVIGGHQTVIKSLGRSLSGVQGVSGATVLADGSLALILDIRRIFSQERERVKYSPAGT